LDIHNLINNPQFYGRRRGRKLSKSSQLAINDGKDYLVKEENISNIFRNQKNIVLEIGFGDGENLINSAKLNSKILYIGADPFLNTTAKCLNKILKYNLNNIVIWPDDIRKILKFFPNNSISEIKILFPDPWPKKRHKNRRLIQDEFIKNIYPVIKHQGTITIATDHDILKNWVLEKFQNHTEFEWVVESSNDWRFRPYECFQTKYELKSINQQRKPSWFIFKKK
jgi:tRNA (guanine-N7-)-methyltransferase